MQLDVSGGWDLQAWLSADLSSHRTTLWQACPVNVDCVRPLTHLIVLAQVQLGLLVSRSDSHNFLLGLATAHRF